MLFCCPSNTDSGLVLDEVCNAVIHNYFILHGLKNEFHLCRHGVDNAGLKCYGLKSICKFWRQIWDLVAFNHGHNSVMA